MTKGETLFKFYNVKNEEMTKNDNRLFAENDRRVCKHHKNSN